MTPVLVQHESKVSRTVAVLHVSPIALVEMRLPYSSYSCKLASDRRHKQLGSLQFLLRIRTFSILVVDCNSSSHHSPEAPGWVCEKLEWSPSIDLLAPNLIVLLLYVDD